MKNNFKICNRCVMDTTDSLISFDDNGICDHCLSYDQITKPFWANLRNNEEEFRKIINKIKSSRRGNYDCILGLSGGVDSSYMLHYAVTKLGLKPLVFHVDGGWNSDISTTNIQSLVNSLNVDLYTEVINWEEMRLFQLAFFKSGVPHIDIPQDHSFIATLYRFANKYKIKWILNGTNFSTEAIKNPLKFLYYGTDMKHIKYIRRTFGAKNMPTYPFSSILKHKLYLKYIKRIKVFKLLDYIEYKKSDAIETLKSNYNWKAYPQKHFESRFTRYFEGYWLPKRFGFDTRKVQFSNLILTNQMSRDDALNQLQTPVFNSVEAEKESRFVAQKLKISLDELYTYLHQPLKFYWDYPNSNSFFNRGAKVLQYLGIEAAIKR